MNNEERWVVKRVIQAYDDFNVGRTETLAIRSMRLSESIASLRVLLEKEQNPLESRKEGSGRIWVKDKDMRALKELEEGLAKELNSLRERVENLEKSMGGVRN